MHKCTIITITVHIYTVTVTCAFIILVFFFLIVLGMWEREVVSKEIIQNCKRINILLNKYIE